MLMKIVNKKQENIYRKKRVDLTTKLVGAWWPSGITLCTYLNSFIITVF